MFRLRQEAVDLKQVGNLYISDIGTTLKPGESYDLTAMYGEEAVRKSTELRSAKAMGWVEEYTPVAKPVKLPTAKAVEPIVTAPVLSNAEPAPAEEVLVARVEALFNLAVKKGIIIEDSGKYTINVATGKKKKIACASKDGVLNQLKIKEVRDAVRAKLLED